MEISPNASLLDMDFQTFSLLADYLERNADWCKVAEFFNIFKRSEIHALSIDNTPGRRLLNELGIRMCTVQTLAHVLRECHLYDALALIAETEPLQMRKHPSDFLNGTDKLKLYIGDTLQLEVDVVGIPPPNFTWYKDNNIIVGQNKSKLTLENYTPSMEGDYYCCASQIIQNETISEICSESISVSTSPTKCIVREKPDEFLIIREGSPILLKLKATAYPKPEYIWMHNNVVLENENKNVLNISRSTKKHEGEYRCCIRNSADEVVIKTTIVIQPESTFKTFQEPVTEKIALLIGNDKYENLEPLSAATNDVAQLAVLLNELGFKTLTLCNLDLQDMERAVKLFAGLIPARAYAFFYYAGHGFSHGDKYLLPVGCPDSNSFMKKDAISESFILNNVLHKEPALFVFLLDMCLKAPERSQNNDIFKEPVQISSFKTKRNLIYGYSTTTHLEAYENTDDCCGIYISALKKYLLKKMPIVTILSKVNEEICTLCPDQMPHISYTTAEEFYLTNPLIGNYKENDLFEKLIFHPIEKICFNSKTTLQMYKGVFYNALELTAENAKQFKYKSNWNDIHYVPGSQDRHSLIIENIQKLNENLQLNLEVDTFQFEIKKSFLRLRDLFMDV